MAVFLAAAAAAAPAAATTWSTLVQFDPTASGTFGGPTAVTGINNFDWQATGTVVIEGALAASSNGWMTLDDFFTNGVTGDTLSFRIHGQARLNEFGAGTPSPAPGLVVNGGSNADLAPDYEVTATFDGVETAILDINALGQKSLLFTGITGTFAYYLDTALGAVGSNVATGVGFNDGTTATNPFLWGSVAGVVGQFNGTTGNGDSNLTMVIDGYDPLVVETDPAAAGVRLVGATFDSNLQLTSKIGSTDYLGKGQTAGASVLSVGGTPYTFIYAGNLGPAGQVSARGTGGELILRADGDSTFTAVPEPGTMLLLGSGLMGLAGLGRRRMKKAA